MGKGSSQEPGAPGPALHAVGSRVWLLLEDSKEGWAQGEVVAVESSSRLRVRLQDGSVKECSQSDLPLQNVGKGGVEVRGEP